nr:uncharacterized protein LOC104110182 [Nicotiana tomentosiformis]
MEYLQCKFRVQPREAGMDMKLDSQVIPDKNSFKYLGWIIQGDGEIDEDVRNRIGVGWMKWRLASGVLCDKIVPLILKDSDWRLTKESPQEWSEGPQERKKPQMQMVRTHATGQDGQPQVPTARATRGRGRGRSRSRGRGTARTTVSQGGAAQTV